VIVRNPENRLAFFREQAAEANAKADAATPLSQGHGKPDEHCGQLAATRGDRRSP